MKKLPIGIQTFSELIKKDYVYVDKTEEALDLISNYKYVFLSRPRRFGKSLFLDTLYDIFSGNRELFQGLYIDNNYDFPAHPIIRISFSGDLRSDKSLIKRLLGILRDNQLSLQLSCSDPTDYSECFKELIQNAYHKYNQQGVVILIDEYDKAVLDNLDQIDVFTSSTFFPPKSMTNKAFVSG